MRRRAFNRPASKLSSHQAARQAPAFRHLVDPDDPSFLNPDDMPSALDCFCRKCDQPAPDSPGSYTRAILESLALKYRLVIQNLESLIQRRVEQIRVIGGGSRNRLLNQFTADARGGLLSLHQPSGDSTEHRSSLHRSEPEATTAASSSHQVRADSTAGSFPSQRVRLDAREPLPASHQVNVDATNCRFRSHRATNDATASACALRRPPPDATAFQ